MKRMNRVLRLAVAGLVSAAIVCSVNGAAGSFAASPADGGGWGVLQERAPGDTSYRKIEGAVLKATTKLDLWHYSENYWMVTNQGQNPIKILDKDILGSITQVIPAEDAVFTLALPEAVKERVRQGDTIIPVIRSGSGAALGDLFAPVGRSFFIDGSQLSFSARPKFNLVPQEQLTFRSYGLDIPVKVPFIQREYGYNMYSVFGNGSNGVQVNGWVNPASKNSISGMPKGWIHPSMIQDEKGTLRPGGQLLIKGKLVPTDGFSVGKGTFSNAGALGLCFEYPVEFTFYARPAVPTEPEKPEPEPEPAGALCELCGQCRLEEAGVCSQATCGDFGTPDCGCYKAPQINGEAALSLPSYTYETHPAVAMDRSQFNIDGIVYSAQRAYAEGYGRNSFRVVQSGSGASVKRVPGTELQAEVIFPNQGNYDVELRVSMAEGSVLRDQKPIEVRKTPAVTASLSGTQKQNRKQVLNIRIAKNTNYPLKEVYAEITRTSGDESVKLIHHTNGAENILQNSDLIKTRPITVESEDQYWLSCRLEFLTKNSSTEDFSYRVYARDSRGQWDEVSADFCVKPDEAPKAEIRLEPEFLREAGSNTAVIRAEDATISDGDQVSRRWEAAIVSGGAFQPAEKLAGFRDVSFGTGKKIEFEKTGVGPLEMRLEVTDVWTEETLPEYISHEDYLTAGAMGVTEVVNVAPVVGLEPLKTRKAEILLLAASEEEYKEMNGTAARLAPLLLEQAVDATVAVERLSPQPDENITYRAGERAQAPYGFEGTWSGFWENGSWAVDDQMLYKAEADWRIPPGGADAYPELPYVIRAYRPEGNKLSEVWSLAITQDMVRPSDRSASAYFAQDNDGMFLYFCTGGKTLLIQKENGALLSVLPFKIGAQNSVSGSFIYTYRNDGIYRISMGDQSHRRIRELSIASGPVRRIGSMDHFLVRQGTRLFRGVFDPASEQLWLELLSGTSSDDGGTSYRLAAVDTEGKLIVSCTRPGSNGSSVASLIIRAYSGENQLLKEVRTSVEGSSGDYVVPVSDAGGVCHYVGLTSRSRGSKKYYVNAQLWGIYNSYYGRAEASDTSGYPTVENRVIMGVEHGDGNCYILTGAEWTYIAGEGYNSSAQGMPERAKGFCFDVPAGGAWVAPNLGSGVWSSISNNVEYGTRSDSYMAVSTGDNNENGAAVHSTQLVRWGQSAEDILLRHINRSLSGKKDQALVVVGDGSGAFETADAAALKARLQQKNGRLVTGTVRPEDIVDMLLPAEEQEIGALAIKSEGDSGYAEKVLQLEPGKTYYYEYDFKGGASQDILQLQPVYSSAVPEAAGLDERYLVKECYSEDFNDGDTNPYFTLNSGKVRGGVYCAAERTDSVSNKTNRWYTDSGSISFVVPQEHQGVLSFDYSVQMDGAQDWMMQFYIDGVLWKNSLAQSGSGHYTHPQLLQPGAHTLSAQCGEYGRGELYVWSRMDNLRVALVDVAGAVKIGMGESHRAGENGTSAEEPRASVKEASGWKQVAGSFSTPFGAASFRRVAADFYQGPVGRIPYTSWVSTEEGRKQIRISLPWQAAYVEIGTASSPAGSGSSQYSVKYTLGSLNWSCTRSNKYPESAAANIPANYKICLRNTAGTMDVKQSSSAFRGAYGDFAEITLVLPKPMIKPLSENKFFLAQGIDGKIGLFAEDETYDGRTVLSLHPGAAGVCQVRDLRVYTIENGVRVYLENSPAAGGEAQWTAVKSQVVAVREKSGSEEDEKRLVYQKGELVVQQAFYSDYEKDPSKKQYWRYIHTPFNDGPHPQAAVILDEENNLVSMPGIVLDQPIARFYTDGKYTVEHWQEDNTARDGSTLGNPKYDKLSNVAALTFYIDGGGQAPWITGIRTIPREVKEGGSCRIAVGVDDVEKDELRLTTEVYLDGKLFYTCRNQPITADPVTSKYKEVMTDALPGRVSCGMYQVVCTVRDWSGAGVGTYRFSVVSEGRITGSVYHTDAWEKNRKKYNLERFGTEGNSPVDFGAYQASKAPRKRGTNVFWPGEVFCLEAAVSGEPLSVWCQIPGTGYRTALKSTGRKNAGGETIYEGTLWNADMVRRWGAMRPEELTFRFSANYGEGSQKLFDAVVIVDNSEEYWQLHRYY